jgi:hypothetical protein
VIGVSERRERDEDTDRERPRSGDRGKIQLEEEETMGVVLCVGPGDRFFSENKSLLFSSALPAFTGLMLSLRVDEHGADANTFRFNRGGGCDWRGRGDWRICRGGTCHERVASLRVLVR